MATGDEVSLKDARSCFRRPVSGFVGAVVHKFARVSLPKRDRSTAAAIISLVFVAGCTSGPLPPVFGAVFGLENAETVRYQSGQILEPTVEAGDFVLGLAANAPGQCVYQRAGSSRRFIANCPDGYDA